ncbi:MULTISPECIES: (d)CMP kinase [Galbibacter]|uniref:Cytidylate kinase n=1 Tax=Galbibacter pacificus TaxID=2996052 RepID=A0ABT6FQJ6_9FLAO|nr:(d)CMP kinase [Galbibacter pacificus]MDG3581984.1 (d)CMP kinase [Galbibacter pacificus]MDG3585542.1 (d)CMP kinase [Galbibacter pacificus]
MKKITIAIDGYSSTGKSTIAKKLAKKLGYVYVDTGAMYRAVALYCLENHLIKENEVLKEELIEKLPEIELLFKITPQTGNADIHLNGKNVEKDIRTLRVSNVVSMVAAVSEVRKKLVQQQQRMGAHKGLVMDGRDIGTVVFPDAELKIFMTASPEKRAIRRYKELIDRGDNVIYDEVLKNVQNRDHIDSTRKDSPLREANDAVKIDSTNLDLEETYKKCLQLALHAIEG